MKKRVLSFVLACLMVVSTFIVVTPHIYVDAVEYIEGVNQWTLPMDWTKDLDKDSNGWELASKMNGLWRLTSFENLTDGSTVRWAASTSPLASGVDNGESPTSYIESRNNRSVFTTLTPDWNNWYVNFGHRYENKAFGKGADLTSMYVYPGNTQKAGSFFNNPTVVFTAPADNTYDFTESVKLILSGAVVSATVRKNGEVLTTATPTASGTTLSGTVELKKDDVLMFAFTLTSETTVKDANPVLDLTNLVVKVHDDTASGGNTVAIGTKYDVPSDFYTGLTSEGTKINGNWQLATYDTKTQQTYYNFKAPSSSHSTAKWYFDNTEEPYAGGGKGTFRYTANSGEYVLGTNPGSNSHPEIASAVIFTAPDDGIYKFDVNTLSRGLNGGSTGSRAVIFFVMKDNVIYDITHPKYNVDTVEAMTGEIALKKGEKLYFCAQRYTYYTEHSNDHGTDWLGARYKALSVEKVAELTAGDEVVTKYTFAPDGTSLINGQFEMKAYDYTTKTLKDLAFTTGTNWQAKNTESGNWIFQYGRIDGSIAGWGPDGTTTADEGAAIVFTAPEKGTYNITGSFNKVYMSNTNGKCYCDYKIIREDGTVVFDGTNFDESASTTGALTHTLGASVKLEKDEKIYIVKSPNATAESGSQRGEIYHLTASKIAERAGEFVSESWELPMDWSTGLEVDDNGWDLAVKGPWKLVVFKDANDVSTIYEQASADKAANGSNVDSIGPGPWIESANNRANTVKDTTTWSDWYINPGKRWQNNVVFAKGNNSSYMKVRPMRDENNKYPTVVFTAPEDGLYSYNEFVTGTCFADENGVTVVGTATVRVNGLVVDSFSPSSSSASKTLKGNVALKKGDLLMFTFALNTPSRFTAEIDGTGVQVFDLGKTVVTRIAPLPADYEIVDHTPVFKGDSATSTSGNVVLKGYDVDADTLYDVIMKPHPDPSVTDKWIAVDPKATNSWDNGATSWNEAEYYAHLWTGTNDGAITGVGGSHQYKSGAALVFTVPSDGTYAFNARLGYGNMKSQPSYSDFVITVNGETVFTNSNYSQTAYLTDSPIAMDMFWMGELKAGDVVVIMKRPNDNTSVINTSDDSSAFVKISEIKNLPAYVEEEEKDPTPSGEYKDWTLPVDWSETDAHNADGYELPVKGNWELLSYNAVGTDPLATFSGTPIGVNNTATSTGKPHPFLAGKKYSSGFGVADWYLNHNEMWSEVGGAFKTAKLDNTYYVTPNVHNGPIAIAFTAPEDNVYTFNEALVVKNFKSSKGDTLSIGAVVYKQATDGTLTALRSFVSSTTEESSATLTRSVKLKTGEKLIFGFYNPLTTTPDFVNNATTEKDYYGCFITDLTVSVGVKDPSQGGTEPGGPSQPGIIPPDTDAAVGDKWNLPTDFYTGMTSAGEKKNGNWQLAAYDTKTLNTYYKFNAPGATHTADNWYIQHSEPYEGQRGSFAYSDRGFETNPGNDNHTEMASVILFTAPADGLYKYDVDTFSYGLNKKSTGSRAVIFYVMKDGVIYDITHPTYNATNTENLTGYIPLKKGEQIYFCAQRYTKYTVAESPNGDWPAWIGARYDALSVEKVAELTAGDEVVTKYTFAPDGTSLVNGQFEMKAYDFINKTVNDATLNSGANWTVTAVSGNTLFWKSATAGSVVGWGPDGTTTNANEGAAIVFTAPEDGKYNITGHFEKTYVKSANGKHYCDYKIIRENGKVIFDGSNYDESTDDSFNYLNHTFGETITLKKGQKIYIVKSPNASATVGAQGADLYALTVTKIATIVPPAGPDERPPYVVTPTPNGSSFDLPMDWSVTGTFDANGWELAQKGPWRLTSFDNPGKVSSIRLKDSTAPIASGVANGKSPWSYIESAYNREGVGSGSGYTTWYMNFTTRWSGAGITYGDNVSYMKITPMNASNKNNPSVVFIAPDDGDYTYSHLVTQLLFDKDGAPVNVTVTVRVNGELVETFNPTVDNPGKTLHGLVHLKAGDVLAFVYSQTTSVTLEDHEEFIRVEATNVTKIGDYTYNEGHHCYGGTATCMSPAICESCGEEYGATDVNNHVAGCVPSYDTTATTHTEFWSKCQTRFTSENHTWVEGKCYVCDYACLHEHDRYAATCISGAICEECYMAHGAKDPNHHVDGLEFAFEYATTKVHYTRWACCMNKFVEAEHTFENGICTVCEIKKGEQGDLAGMLPGTGTDYDFIPNPAAGKGSWNPQTGTISIIAVISTAVVSTVTGKAASKKRRRRI